MEASNSEEIITEEYDHQYVTNNRSYVCEIEEVESGRFSDNKTGLSLASIKENMVGSLIPGCTDQNPEECVCVGVGKGESSMDALKWTLKHLINSQGTTINLVHVFPEIHYVPSPLGNIPKSQVNPDQLESFVSQERDKRRQLLQKFLDLCNANKVNVETMLIESDMVAKAILDLIPVLNINKLVIGANKSSLRKLKSRKGSGIADQILQKVPDTCELKIICQGNEVILEQSTESSLLSPSPSPSPSSLTISRRPRSVQDVPPFNGLGSCMSCFKAKVTS